MKYTEFETAPLKDLWIHKNGEKTMELKITDILPTADHKGDVEGHVINIHDDVEYHKIYGFGGTFNDSVTSNYVIMPESVQEQLISLYFDKENGIGYTFGRLPVGSIDFSKDTYDYVDDGDYTLGSFSIGHDIPKAVKMIKEAMKHTEISIFASPWSPPAFMKTNGSKIGGKLKDDCYGLYARYIRKFYDAYLNEGIKIWGFTLQNEPRQTQIWESCMYTPDEELKLYSCLKEEFKDTDVKFFCFDHGRERVYERAKYMFESETGKSLDGIAHHWYSGFHEGETAAVSRKYPDKLIIASEGTSASKTPEPKFSKNLGLRYAEDIISTLSSGTNIYCDFCMVLDEESGPYHNREGRGTYADPVMYYDRNRKELLPQPAYYFIGHFSKFIKPGAVVINSSSYTHSLRILSVKNPDGTVVANILNTTNSDQPAVLRLDGYVSDITLSPDSIKTFIIEK